MEIIAEEHFGSWVRYHRSFEKYSQMKQTDRSSCEVYVMIGPPGIGKTHKAKSLATTNYIHTPGRLWFPGYANEACLILDEFRWKDFPYEFLLSLCDPLKTPQLEYKGGHFKCTSTIVVLTGNGSPRDWYPGEKFGAFQRRVHHWMVFDPANVDQPKDWGRDFEGFLLHLNTIDLYKEIHRNAGDP